MYETNVIIQSKKFHHLNKFQRGQIEALLKLNLPKTQIAKQVGISRSTLYLELKRGTTTQMNSDLTFREEYFAYTGQVVYEKHRKNSRKSLKISRVGDFMNFAEEKILKEKWSPDSVCGYAKLHHLFSKIVCTNTLYRYIDLQLTKIKNINLKQKLRRKPKKKYSHEHVKKMGDPIDLRPPCVNKRLEFGHWEIDLMLGNRSNDEVLLTLDERMTRFRHIIRLPSKKAACVVSALQTLQLHYGDNFSKIFKSITADNGSEFADLCNSAVQIYYAHPYSAWERGTNERQNGLVRFFIPKGKPISDVSDFSIKKVEHWINTIPRKIFGYLSSKELFDKQISLIA